MEKISLSVLVVGGEPNSNNRILRSIEQLNHSVEVAETCEEGLHKLYQQNFDHAFIDVHLPDGDGINLMMKAITLFPEIPIVAMGEKLSLKEERRIREQRNILILIKPFPQKFIQQILDHVAWRMENTITKQRADLTVNQSTFRWK